MDNNTTSPNEIKIADAKPPVLTDRDNDVCCENVDLNYLSQLLMKRALDEAPGMFEFWLKGFLCRLKQLLDALARMYPTCPHISDIDSIAGIASVIISRNGGSITHESIDSYFKDIGRWEE